MSLLNIHDPALLWIYFEEICNIPRLSKNEIRIRRYLIDFALKNNLEHKEDAVGNILIIRPASKGFENKKTIVLQSHMDMVGEKNSDYSHNWINDPIIPYLKNGWVGARGTTLGADDGIGIAAQMAILSDKSLEAGKIECLFTVDEESGMTGAINLKPDFFSGNTLLNLDSEDEGILYIGCAGGTDTVGKMRYQTVSPELNSCALEISITGLRGGHSGDEIHIGYFNAVKVMTSLLCMLNGQYNISVTRFNGGNLRNAIPREAFATITVNNNLTSGLKESVAGFYHKVLNDPDNIEPGLKIGIRNADMPEGVMDRGNQSKLLEALEKCPHGVIRWSQEMDDLVETSTNLASIKFTDKGIVTIVTTQRSSSDSSKLEIAEMVEKCLKIACSEVTHSEGYPGWRPNLSSEILKITKSSYSKLFGKEPKVRAIHAGLECGLIYEKNKMIDMISFGPSIRGAHTTEEMINIESTQRFWDLLVKVIKNIPENA